MPFFAKLLRASLLSASLVGLAPPVSAAAIDEEVRIAGIPAWVTSIVSCGHYSADSGVRYFRILYAAFVRGNSLLYVQWMGQGYAAAEPESLFTLTLPEFDSDDHGELTFPMPRCVETRQGIRLHIVARSGHDNRLHRFELRLGRLPGQYSLRPR